MAQKGPIMVASTWEAVAQLWHPQLKNVAGPWDRSYGFDMNKYLSLMALHLWSYVGKENSSVISKPYVMSHNADFAWAPLIAILAPFHETLIPESVFPALKEFSGEHTFTSSTFSPPFDTYPRNITAWLAPNISIGAETYSENVIGGPAKNPGTFNPALIQWETGNGIGFITLYATEYAVTAEAKPGTLNLTYPLGNSSSIFSLIVSPFLAKPTVSTLEDIQGLNVTVSGTVNETYAVSFAGSYGGSDSTIK
ncbi:hypothetical protein PVAG01_03540 [Phlyctema vagabunda]|uniref:Uncharacterized protein n=1 Tax=Phlyctema vagabunda TaxID=108571 RepID=A0ABR4PLS5_9HELO